MNDAYISTIAALAGSAIGALASLGTAWLTLNLQERAHWFAQAVSRKENLYGQFIEEASKILNDALTHNLDDASKVVHLYALVGKLRLFAPSGVLTTADEVLRRIFELYEGSKKDLHAMILEKRERDLDILREFSEACRSDLNY